MSIRAEADRKFNRRNIIIAVVSLGIGMWGAYDGFIAYPKKLKYAEEYAKLFHLDAQSKSENWREITKKKGWSRDVPKNPADVQGTIIFNYCLTVAGGLIGAFFLFKFFRMRTSWIEADEKGIKTSFGQSLEFSNVTKLDKVKWEKKGIAKVSYSASGSEKTMVIDDFKYMREPTGEILTMVEKRLKPEQIKLPFSDEEDAGVDSGETADGD